MTTHTLEALDPEAPLGGGGWTATCSCHNPDGDGVGRADFRGETAYLAYLAWAEHAAAQPDDLGEKPGGIYARLVKSHRGGGDDEVRLHRSLGGDVVLSIHTQGRGCHSSTYVYLSDKGWNTLRGAR